MTDDDHLPCRVRWTPRGGVSRTVEGNYLTMWEHRPALACGFEQIASELDLWKLVGDHYVAICTAVNTQFEHQPWAELKCREGTARLELVPHG